MSTEESSGSSAPTRKRALSSSSDAPETAGHSDNNRKRLRIVSQTQTETPASESNSSKEESSPSVDDKPPVQDGEDRGSGGETPAVDPASQLDSSFEESIANTSVDDRSTVQADETQRRRPGLLASPLATRFPGSIARVPSRSSLRRTNSRLSLRSEPGELRQAPSSSSLREKANEAPFPQISAKHYLNAGQVNIGLPPSQGSITSLPITCSWKNILYFGLGDTVYVKNLHSVDPTKSLCTIPAKKGEPKILSCNRGVSEALAVGTTKGVIQIWDVNAQKQTATWSTSNGVTALHWNGSLLTVGGTKGAIRSFDTRTPPSKIKEQATKMTRHQSSVTTLAWNESKMILASGDARGLVYCWDSRQQAPLDVGEFALRRKKMAHPTSITALAWCPWEERILITGDSSGTVRLWNVNPYATGSNALTPGTLCLSAPVAGIHFSAQCKEFITIHGTPPPPPPSAAASDGTETTAPVLAPLPNANCILAHTFPTLRSVASLRVAEKPIGTSVLTAVGNQVIVSVPTEKTLKVCGVWGWKREVRKRPSYQGLIR